MTVEELRNKLISEAQSCWNKLNITKRVSGSEFSYYDGYIDCGFIKEEQIQIDAEQIRALQKQNGELTDKVKELEAQIENLIDFVLSKTECCDVCPITDTCINSEGTCPYVGILAKGEEEVTREWLVQKIAKEIKEK